MDTRECYGFRPCLHCGAICDGDACSDACLRALAEEARWQDAHPCAASDADDPHPCRCDGGEDACTRCASCLEQEEEAAACAQWYRVDLGSGRLAIVTPERVREVAAADFGDPEAVVAAGRFRSTWAIYSLGDHLVEEEWRQLWSDDSPLRAAAAREVTR
jgi:hypothetical protein